MFFFTQPNSVIIKMRTQPSYFDALVFCECEFRLSTILHILRIEFSNQIKHTVLFSVEKKKPNCLLILFDCLFRCVSVRVFVSAYESLSSRLFCTQSERECEHEGCVQWKPTLFIHTESKKTVGIQFRRNVRLWFMQNKRKTVEKSLHRLNTMCNDWIKEFWFSF